MDISEEIKYKNNKCKPSIYTVDPFTSSFPLLACYFGVRDNKNLVIKEQRIVVAGINPEQIFVLA